MITGPVDIVDDAGVITAFLRGDIDISATALIRSEVLDAIPDHAVGLIVDLSAVRYLDSAGVHMLSQLKRQLDQTGQLMALAVPEDSPIRTLLKITHLDEAIAVHPSRERCAAHLASLPRTTE